MKRFVQGESRTQGTLPPERLDDSIAENNPIRVMDVFVDELDLGQLGFEAVAEGGSVSEWNTRVNPETSFLGSFSR